MTSLASEDEDIILPDIAADKDFSWERLEDDRLQKVHEFCTSGMFTRVTALMELVAPTKSCWYSQTASELAAGIYLQPLAPRRPADVVILSDTEEIPDDAIESEDQPDAKRQHPSAASVNQNLAKRRKIAAASIPLDFARPVPDNNLEGKLKAQRDALYEIVQYAAHRPDKTRRSLAYLGKSDQEQKLMCQIRAHHPLRQEFDLMPHQRENIGQMAALEAKFNGGLLGSDMGTGKTIQLICFIILNPQPEPTLVVLPASIASNWIRELMSVGVLQSDIYHHEASKGTATADIFRKHRWVLVSYNKLYAEYNNACRVQKCYRMRQSDPTAEYIITYDNSKPIQKEMSRIRISTERTQCPLLTLRWGRVVLDEGHRIRNQSTATHKAACCIESDKRWLMTGTPFANDYPDIQSVYRFLRIAPLDDILFFKPYFTKTITSKQNARVESVPLEGIRGGILHMCLQAVMIRQMKSDRFERQGVTSLIPATWEDIVLKLDWIGRNPCIFDTTAIYLDKLNARSLSETYQIRDFFRFNASYAGSNAKLLGLAKSKTVMTKNLFAKNQFTEPLSESDLQWYIRRQWSNPFRLVVFSGTAKQRKAKAGIGRVMEDVVVVPMMRALLQAIHYAIPTAQYALKDERTEQEKQQAREIGDAGFNTEDVLLEIAGGECTPSEFVSRRQAFIKKMKQGENYRSTKIDAAVNWAKSRLEEDKGKILIFCSSLVALDIAKVGLGRHGVEALEYNGTLSASEKDVAEQQFQEPSDEVRVMLVQSAAGGVGSNFTAATSVLFLSPEWSKIVELQAAARADRIGQLHQVRIVRLLAKYSMDDRVLEKQAVKVSKANGLLNLDREGLSHEDEAIQKKLKEVVAILKASGWSKDEFSTALQAAYRATKKEEADARAAMQEAAQALLSEGESDDCDDDGLGFDHEVEIDGAHRAHLSSLIQDIDGWMDGLDDPFE